MLYKKLAEFYKEASENPSRLKKTEILAKFLREIHEQDKDVLYLLMGISLYLVWEKKDKRRVIRGKGLQFFALQLGLNVLWSAMFFGQKSPALGLLVIVLLWVAIFQTIKFFGKINTAASYLLYPYLLWVSFAAVLNFMIWQLNR